MAVRRLSPNQPESFEFDAERKKAVNNWIKQYPESRKASAVIPLLNLVQEQSGWVSEPGIKVVAKLLEMPFIRVLEVATFYTMFHLEPKGELAHIQVCGTPPCTLRGCSNLIEICKKRISDKSGGVSADKKFSWEEVECLGACVNAPVVQISKDYYEDLDADSFSRLLDNLEQGKNIKPGSSIGRQNSAPACGKTTLLNIK